ncbi:hypothetical protein Tco_0789790 [Tanacetum coccineum]
MGDTNPIRTLGDYSKPSHEGYRNTIELPIHHHMGGSYYSFPCSILSTGKDCKTPQRYGIDLWLQVEIFYDHVNPVTRRTIDQSARGKLRDKNAKESWALLEDLALYDNESWNDPRDFAKPVKGISLPQDVSSTSDPRLIELKNQVQHLMEAHLDPKQPVQVNKISSSCEICSGPHDTQYCMENPEQAFVEYASSRTDEAGGLVSNFMASQDARLSKFEADFKQQQGEMTNKIDTVLKAITDRITGALPSDTQPNKSRDDKSEEEGRKEEGNPENINTTLPSPPDPSNSFITKKVRKLNSFLESSDLVPRSLDTKFFCTKDDGDVMFIEIIKKYNDSHEEGPEDKENTIIEGLEVEYFDIFPTRSELAYHKYLMSGPIPSLFLRNPIITEGCPSNLKIPCNIGHVYRIRKGHARICRKYELRHRFYHFGKYKTNIDPSFPDVIFGTTIH